MMKLKTGIIGTLQIQLLLPNSHSLKEKRSIINSLKEKMQSKLNIAVSELDNSEKWQTANLLIVTVSNNFSIAEKTLKECLRIVESKLDCVILHADFQWQ